MVTAEKKSVKVGKFVTTEHVNTVVGNYKQERWVHNSKRIGKEDSLSVWFSVEDLEEFIGKLKEHGGDGVRFYFGAYSEDFKEQPLYAGRQTMVMVATRQKESIDGVTNKDLYINDGDKPGLLAYNMATMCPPFCPSVYSKQTGVTIVDKGEDGFVVI